MRMTTNQFQQAILPKFLATKKFNSNIQVQISTLKSSELLSFKGKGFRVATGKTPTPQEHNLLNFREIGKEAFDNYVSFSILKKPSVKAPQRKRKLATLSDKKPTKSRLSKVEKDLKLVQKCLHKKLKWSKKSQQPVDVIAEQYIPLPLAIADNDGIPIKGNKSYTTKALNSCGHQPTSP